MTAFKAEIRTIPLGFSRKRGLGRLKLNSRSCSIYRFTSRAILYQHLPASRSLAYIAARIAGVDMALIQSERLVSSMTQQAQALLNQFVLDQQQCPERAWEALAELCGVIGQLQELYPFRAFRLRQSVTKRSGR